MLYMIKNIGITGGIGSGKSLIASLFEGMGYAIYAADQRAKALMTQDPELVAGVKNLFGPEAYLPDASLNRTLIGSIVFKDAAMLSRLNALVHPATGRDYIHWQSEIAASGYDRPFVLKEAAILFESGAYKLSDLVISVYAPKQLRIQRVIQRDQSSAEAVAARMSKQWPEQEKMQRADFVIINDGQHHLIPQVREAIRFCRAPLPGR